MFYAAKIEKDRELGFVVSFPDLPNVNAFGATKKEALKMAEEALNGSLEVYLDRGMTLIEPRTMPDEDSGLFAIDVKPELEIAYKLFEARRRMKKADVARRAGISPQAYQRFKKKKNSPTVATLYKLAKAMGKRLEISLV